MASLDNSSNFFDLYNTEGSLDHNSITVLQLHRGNIFTELLNSFQNGLLSLTKVKIEMILANGEAESASDAGGVLRDALSEFWQEFYEKCTLGTCLKVPYIRHDFGELQWQSIGKILAEGWKCQRYFPIRIAPCFMLSCLGQYSPDDNMLVQNFLKYISESEAESLRNALENFDDVDNNDIIEILSGFDCKWLPKKDNIKQLLIDIAHKELVQKPSFVAKCFHGYLQHIMESELKGVYADLEPSPRNILSKIILSENDSSSPPKNVYEYLRKYIKEADLKKRSSFLRFCTGSDVVNGTILLTFTNTEGFHRMPVSHTCSGVLELSLNYDNFIDFRSEMNSILDTNIWVMDVV